MQNILNIKHLEYGMSYSNCKLYRKSFINTIKIQFRLFSKPTHMSAAFVRKITGPFIFLSCRCFTPIPIFISWAHPVICINIFVTIFIIRLSVFQWAYFYSHGQQLSYTGLDFRIERIPFLHGWHTFVYGGFDPIWHQLLGSLSHDLARKSTCSQAKIGRITQIT